MLEHILQPKSLNHKDEKLMVAVCSLGVFFYKSGFTFIYKHTRTILNLTKKVKWSFQITGYKFSAFL